jgi:PPOX class probable F420-dependent enzyme
MSSPIPDSHTDLLEKPVYAVFTTVTANGELQSTVVWCDYDGEFVRVNSAAGRHKNKNVQQNPNVSLTLIDPEDPFRWLAVRGKVEQIVAGDEGVAHITQLSLKYKGKVYYGENSYTGQPQGDQIREVFKIRPVKVTTFPIKRG